MHPCSKHCQHDEQKGTTFLHGACHSGNVRSVVDLLKNQANINATDKSGNTPLLIACRRGHVDTVNALLSKKPQMDIRTQDSGRTVLHACVECGNVDLLHILIKSFDGEDEKAAFLCAQDNAGWTALHIAAEKGHVEVVKTLLGETALVNVPNKKGSTPLFQACLNGHFEVARILLEHCAEVNPESSDNTSPLHVACVGSTDRVEIVQLLLERKASVNAKEKSKGWTALHYSAQNGTIKSVEALVKVSRELVNRASFEGVTPLHLSCLEGRADVADTLLRYGARVNVKDRQGSTPLHVAAANSHADVVTLLLQHGAAKGTRNHPGNTPVDLAHGRNHGHVVDTLIALNLFDNLQL